jgi:hypothetical protein
VCKTAQGEDKQEQTQEKVRGPYMRLGNTMLARSSEHPSVRACCVHVWLSVVRVLRVLLLTINESIWQNTAGNKLIIHFL